MNESKSNSLGVAIFAGVVSGLIYYLLTVK